MPPVPIDTRVAYPPGASGDGSVVLELTIEVDGTVSAVDKVDGPEPFAAEAARAATTWKFEPARRGGRAVRARIRFQTRFVGAHPDQGSQPARPAPAPAISPGIPQKREYTITVSGERAAPGGVTLSRVEGRLLPGVFGDPFRTVESLPGVTPIVSMFPFFFMRGAPPGNVGYFVDGVRVPLLFHEFVGPPALQPALIESIDVYKGGAPARYGRFAGGIIAATTVTPEDIPHAEAGLHLLDASAYASAPFADGKGHAFAAGRYSFTGLLLSQLTNGVLDYWDYQVRSSYDLSRDDTIGIFGFGALDFAGEKGGTDFGGTQFHRADLRYDHTFGSATKLRSAVTLGYDHSLASGGNVTDTSIAFRTVVEHRFGSTVLRTGADAAFDHYSLHITDPSVSFRDATTLFPERTDTVTGAYVDFEVHPNPWLTITPGVRSDVFHSQNRTVVGIDPRVGAEFRVSRKVKLIDDLALSHQTPNYLPNLPGAQIAALRGGLQKALQYSSGVELALPDDMTTSVTGFEQVFFNLSDPLGYSGSIAANTDIVDVRGLGYAYGLEWMLKRSLTRRLGGILSYTLSRSVRSHGNLNSLSGFDRTHVASFAFSYDLGRSFRFGSRGLFASGVPTRELTIDGPRFVGERAPASFRLDLRLEKQWRLGERGHVTAFVEVLNATANHEITQRSCNALRCTEAGFGPLVLPNFGVDAGF